MSTITSWVRALLALPGDIAASFIVFGMQLVGFTDDERWYTRLSTGISVIAWTALVVAGIWLAQR